MRRFLHKVFGSISLAPIKRGFEHFHQTLQEGHYGADKTSMWSFLFKPKEADDEAAPVAASSKLIKMTSKALSTKYFIPALLAVLSVQMQMATLVGIAVLAGGVLAGEYLRCRRLRNQIITEVNVAGQKVTGTRADLCRLHRAQASILNLSSSFRQASLESTGDTINDIIASVSAESARVTIENGGHYGAGTAGYAFSRQTLGLVNAQPEVVPQTEISRDDVVGRLLALEKSLPDGLREQFQKALKAQKAQVSQTMAKVVTKPAKVFALAA